MNNQRATKVKPRQARTQSKRPSSSPMAVEICNECGRSVALGGGRFVNRVPDLNDAETRRVDDNHILKVTSCARSVTRSAPGIRNLGGSERNAWSEVGGKEGTVRLPLA